MLVISSSQQIREVAEPKIVDLQNSEEFRRVWNKEISFVSIFFFLTNVN